MLGETDLFGDSVIMHSYNSYFYLCSLGSNEMSLNVFLLKILEKSFDGY